MQTEILVLADGVLDWYIKRKNEIMLADMESILDQTQTSGMARYAEQELKQLQVARDAQLAVIVGITICGCGRCGR